VLIGLRRPPLAADSERDQPGQTTLWWRVRPLPRACRVESAAGHFLPSSLAVVQQLEPKQSHQAVARVRTNCTATVCDPSAAQAMPCGSAVAGFERQQTTPAAGPTRAAIRRPAGWIGLILENRLAPAPGCPLGPNWLRYQRKAQGLSRHSPGLLGSERVTRSAQSAALPVSRG